MKKLILIILAIAGCADVEPPDSTVNLTLTSVGTHTPVESESIEELIRLQGLADDLEREHGRHMAEVGYVLTKDDQHAYTQRFWGTQSSDVVGNPPAGATSEFPTRDDVYTSLNDAAITLYSQVAATMNTRPSGEFRTYFELMMNESNDLVRRVDLALFLEAIEALAETQFADDVAPFLTEALTFEEDGVFPAQIVAQVYISTTYIEDTYSRISQQTLTQMLLERAEDFSVGDYLDEMERVFTHDGRLPQSTLLGDLTAATGSVREVWDATGNASVAQYTDFVDRLTAEAREGGGFLTRNGSQKLTALRGTMATLSAWHAMNAIFEEAGSDNHGVVSLIVILDEVLVLEGSARTGLVPALRLLGRSAKITQRFDADAMATLLNNARWAARMQLIGASLGAMADVASVVANPDRNRWDYWSLSGSAMVLAGSIYGVAAAVSTPVVVVVSVGAIIHLALSTIARHVQGQEERDALVSDIEGILSAIGFTEVEATRLVNAEPEAVEVLRGESTVYGSMGQRLNFTTEQIQDFSGYAPNALVDMSEAGALSLLVTSRDVCFGSDPIADIAEVPDFAGKLNNLGPAFAGAHSSFCTASSCATNVIRDETIRRSGLGEKPFGDHLTCGGGYEVFLPVIL